MEKGLSHWQTHFFAGLDLMVLPYDTTSPDERLCSEHPHTLTVERVEKSYMYPIRSTAVETFSCINRPSQLVRTRIAQMFSERNRLFNTTD
jgi:hypothetical protein